MTATSKTSSSPLLNEWTGKAKVTVHTFTPQAGCSGLFITDVLWPHGQQVSSHMWQPRKDSKKTNNKLVICPHRGKGGGGHKHSCTVKRPMCTGIIMIQNGFLFHWAEKFTQLTLRAWFLRISNLAINTVPNYTPRRKAMRCLQIQANAESESLPTQAAS